jgi:hypothetical protein
VKRPIDYRDARLVIALVGALDDAEGPVEEADLLTAHGGKQWGPPTVRRTLLELVDFGAVRRLAPLRAPVAYRLTPLGRAWADRRLEPYVGPERDDDEDGTPGV